MEIIDKSQIYETVRIDVPDISATNKSIPIRACSFYKCFLIGKYFCEYVRPFTGQCVNIKVFDIIEQKKIEDSKVKWLYLDNIYLDNIGNKFIHIIETDDIFYVCLCKKLLYGNTKTLEKIGEIENIRAYSGCNKYVLVCNIVYMLPCKQNNYEFTHIAVLDEKKWKIYETCKIIFM